MVTSQNARKGAQSSRTISFDPQRNWDLFSPTETIPKDVKGTILLPTEKTILIHEKYEMEGFT
jgi:hypothetical protein